MTEDVFGIVGTVQAGCFRVDQVVAEGGFAVVYRAHHTGFRTDVALKCLKVPGALTGDAESEFLEKFREEGELLFRLSSVIPNIVRPLHVGTVSHANVPFVPFIAIEWLEGETLDRMIERRRDRGEPPMSLGRVLALLGPVADALSRAHRFPGSGGVVSVLHRDLKPENIFVASVHGEEITKILDYGIAKVKSHATQIVGRLSAKQDALNAFTPAYGAPEQWLPKRYGQTGTWTDVWGLAITAVECLCGHAPVEGDSAAMMGSIIDPERRPTPRSEGASVNDAVEAVFARALAVDPKDRYHDIKVFWSELERAAAARAGAVAPAPPDPTSRTAVRPAAVARAVPDLDVPRPSEKKRPAIGPELAASPPSRSARAAPGPADFFDEHSGMLSSNLQLDAAPARRRVAPATASYGAHYSAPRARLDLSKPVGLLLLAVALMAADWLYAQATGEVIRLGPAKMLWVAGPIALMGAAQLVARLLGQAE